MRIFLSIVFSISIISADCLGDANLDNEINNEDIIMMVQHILHMDIMDSLNVESADINGTSTVDIYDLSRVIDVINFNQSNDCNTFTSIDLSLEWETEQDVSYFDSELLNEVVNQNIGQMQSIRGVIVIHRGKIVTEEYFNNSFMSETYNIWSVTKSYISTLIGQAIDYGYIEDQLLTLDDVFFENPYTNQVTIEHLLTMSSGWPENWTYMFIQNPLNTLLNTGLIWSPGTSWLYNNAICHLNAHVINELTQMSPRQFAQENLFPQLGIMDPYWNEDQDNVHNGSFDLHLTLREMVKLGQLYLQDGMSLNNQILSSEWIENATTSQINDWYGYLWWLPGIGYLAVGLGGQYIAVVPELDLVIGTHSATQSSDAYTDQLLSYIYNQIVPIFDLENRMDNSTLLLDQIHEY
ncbi:MAG: serine hydrolase [Candidatus Neomarinimicrobiota bacterium]|tara:strand:- start:1095 stop:2321 length:1227 start_codon:yes stop_codon:yes gene_type:complete